MKVILESKNFKALPRYPTIQTKCNKYIDKQESVEYKNKKQVKKMKALGLHGNPKVHKNGYP